MQWVVLRVTVDELRKKIKRLNYLKAIAELTDMREKFHNFSMHLIVFCILFCVGKIIIRTYFFIFFINTRLSV